jgi:hypothetical protein
MNRIDCVGVGRSRDGVPAFRLSLSLSLSLCTRLREAIKLAIRGCFLYSATEAQMNVKVSGATAVL